MKVCLLRKEDSMRETHRERDTHGEVAAAGARLQSQEAEFVITQGGQAEEGLHPVRQSEMVIEVAEVRFPREQACASRHLKLHQVRWVGEFHMRGVDEQTVGGPRVNDQPVLVAGIGAVAILPDWQGQGAGRQLLAAVKTILANNAMADFGFLQCRDDVTGFYEKSGFHRIPQPVRSFDPDRLVWQTDDTATLILPVALPLQAWPRDGIVDLMGMPW